MTIAILQINATSLIFIFLNWSRDIYTQKMLILIPPSVIENLLCRAGEESGSVKIPGQQIRDGDNRCTLPDVEEQQKRLVPIYTHTIIIYICRYIYIYTYFTMFICTYIYMCVYMHILACMWNVLPLQTSQRCAM